MRVFITMTDDTRDDTKPKRLLEIRIDDAEHLTDAQTVSIIAAITRVIAKNAEPPAGALIKINEYV